MSIQGFDHVALPGGDLAAHHESVVAVNLQNGESAVIATVKDSVAAVCATADGTVYFSSGADVYRARP